MGHVFISYSHADSSLANKLANDLLDQGYDVWIDALRLSGGAEWNKKIEQAIDDCDAFLLLWTSNIEGSGYIRKELQRAIQKGKAVIPLFHSGAPDRMWDEITNFHRIDFNPLPEGFRLLQEALETKGIRSETRPPSLRDLRAQGDMTFDRAARLWRSKLEYPLEGGRKAIGLLLERSEAGIYSYLVGLDDQRIREPEYIQVFFNFSGLVQKDRFDDYLGYALNKHVDIWTVLVRGPISHQEIGPSFRMPDNDQHVWEEALRIAWEAIGQVGREHTPLHLYFNAPVALAAGFCANEHFRRQVNIYQLTNSSKRYFLAYSLHHQ